MVLSLARVSLIIQGAFRERKRVANLVKFFRAEDDEKVVHFPSLHAKGAISLFIEASGLRGRSSGDGGFACPKALDMGFVDCHNSPQLFGARDKGKEGQNRVNSSANFGTELVVRGSGDRDRLDIVELNNAGFFRLGKEERMRKATPFSLIPLFVVAFSISAFAQAERDVKTGGAGREETLKLTINGGWNVAWLHVSHALTELPDAGTGGGTGSTLSQVVGTLNIDLRASIQDNIDVMVRIERPFGLDSGIESAEFGSGGFSYSFAFNAFGFGGDPVGSNLVASQVYLTVRELFDPAITLTVGQFGHKFDVRGTGDAMNLDLGNSEPLGPNFDVDAGSSGDGVPNGVARGVAYWAGVRVSYSRDKFALNAGLMQHDELPGGIDAHDQLERVFFVDATFDVTEDGSKVGVLGTWTFTDFGFPGDGKDDSFITIGASANIHVATDIDVFVEIYMVKGDYGNFPGPSTDIDALGYRVGAHMKFPGSTPAWVEVSVKSLSGGKSTDADDLRYKSYENDDDMLYFDSNEYGIDLDENVFMIKVKGGVSLSTGGGTNNLNLIGKIAIVQAEEDFDLSPEDTWGNEFNATLEYMLNKNAKIYVTLGYVFSADIFAAPVGFATEDSGLMFLVGTSGNW